MQRHNRLFIVFLLAFILRISLIFVAHHGDLNNNISWGTLAVERGLGGFYEGEDWPFSAPNQPPLTILMLVGVRAIWQAVETTSWWLNNNVNFFYSPFIWFWEEKGMTLLVKLPGILADLGIGWLIYEYFRKKNRIKLGLRLTTVWLFNPVIWYNSAVWGQTDSVVNLLGLIAVFALLDKKLIKVGIFMTLSLLFKGSLAVFTPILLVAAYLQKHRLKVWLKAASYSLIATVLVSMWFHPQIDVFFWLFNLYKQRILSGEIGFLTANAFNFWWLIDSGETLDSNIFLGIPARIWGFAIAGIGTAGIIYWLRKKFSDKTLFFSLALVALLTFLFMTRIHERYLYPFFPPATILLGLIPGLALPYTILSALHLLNLYHLFWAPSFTSLEALYRTSWFAYAIAMLNILIFFYLLRLLKKARI